MKRCQFHKSGGFTMIELMAAMAILIMITLFVGRIFSDSSKMWKLGLRRVTDGLDGRAALGFMLRELSTAVVDDVLTMKQNPIYRVVFNRNTDSIFFISMAQTPGSNKRHAMQISYRIEPMTEIKNNTTNSIPNRFRLVRSSILNTGSNYDCYQNTNWYNNSIMTNFASYDVLAENVRTVEFWIYGQDGELVNNDFDEYISTSTNRPAYIEVYLGMMSGDESARITYLSGDDAINLANEASRRYAGRAYLNMGRGYAPDM